MKTIIKSTSIIALFAIIGISINACNNTNKDSDDPECKCTNECNCNCSSDCTGECPFCEATNNVCKTHTMKWIVTNTTTYPATSTEKCIICDTSSDSATRNTQIGDIGPAGGIIFYVKAEGFIVEGYESTFDNYTAHYLEAAPTRDFNARWSSATMVNKIENLSNNIGSGRKNTHILKNSLAYNNAARVCIDKNTNGFTDWFLPSINELKEMNKVKGVEGILKDGVCWSSSQHGLVTKMDSSTGHRPIYILYALCFDFSFGASRYAETTVFYRVHAIRAF